MKLTFRISVVLVFVSIFSFSPLQAQEDSTGQSIFQLSLEELMNVVITPSKMPQFVGNVTQKIDVIDAMEIGTSVSGNRNICEVIAKLPGASVSVLSRNDANWGTYGGIGPKYNTYMLQGVPLDDFVDPMSLDLNAIEHIEVQRGPASVFYPNFLSQDFAGIQSPLAGTVNLILKGKIEEPKTSFQTSYGSYNTLNGQLYHQNNVGSLNYFCGTSYEISDYTNYGSPGSWLNMNKDPEYKKTKLYGGMTWFMDENEKQKLSLFCQETWHTGDKGRVYQGYENQYGTLNAGYDIMVNDRFSLQSHLGIRSYDRAWQGSSIGVVDTLTSNTGVNQLIIPVDLSLSWALGEANMLSIGGDYQAAKYYTWDDPLTGSRRFGNKSSAMQGGLYAQEEWRPMSKLTLRGGVRYAYVKNIITLVNGALPGNDKNSWEKLLWSVGARYSILEKVAIYANSGTSFATPALKSIGGTIPLSDWGVIGKDGQLPNPNLKPESGFSVDGGVDIKLPDNLNVGARLFYTIIQDAIVDNVVSRNPSQSQSINTGNSKSVGGEIELTHAVSELFSWFVNATYMKTSIKNDVDPSQNNSEIPFSPNFVMNIGASYHSLSGFTCSTTLNYNNGFYDGTSKNDRHFFEPGIILNAFIEQLIIEENTFTLRGFAQLYNITNNQYEMPWQFQNPGFSTMVGIKISF